MTEGERADRVRTAKLIYATNRCETGSTGVVKCCKCTRILQCVAESVERAASHKVGSVIICASSAHERHKAKQVIRCARIRDVITPTPHQPRAPSRCVSNVASVAARCMYGARAQHTPRKLTVT